ncbi:MAG: recombinase family protein [Planctomycetia bacterium]|nr:recombinase family protein [Planctomycetia bacterium]
MTGKLVISTRFSRDMRRQDSSADQERDVRAVLARTGIDTSGAVVVADEAESGTKADREKFELLKAMVGRDEVGILAVDDQSRLSRADNVFGFIQDPVYHGGRLISTGEGIDTVQKG